MKVIPLALVLIGLNGESLWARSRLSAWTESVNLGPVVNSAFNDLAPSVSPDGLSLYFASNRPGGFGAVDIWVSQRRSLRAPWGPPMNLGPVVNSPALDTVPNLSRDGHWLFFSSTRPGGAGDFDLWVSWRANRHDDFGWGDPINLATVNSDAFDAGASPLWPRSACRHQRAARCRALLFFTSNRPDVLGDPDIYVATGGALGLARPPELVRELSSPDVDTRPSVRVDGLEIFLESDRAESLGSSDLWSSRRRRPRDPWSKPSNLGPNVNTGYAERQPFITADERHLLFSSNRPGGQGGFDLYLTRRARRWKRR